MAGTGREELMSGRGKDSAKKECMMPQQMTGGYGEEERQAMRVPARNDTRTMPRL